MATVLARKGGETRLRDGLRRDDFGAEPHEESRRDYIPRRLLVRRGVIGSC